MGGGARLPPGDASAPLENTRGAAWERRLAAREAALRDAEARVAAVSAAAEEEASRRDASSREREAAAAAAAAAAADRVAEADAIIAGQDRAREALEAERRKVEAERASLSADVAKRDRRLRRASETSSDARMKSGTSPRETRNRLARRRWRSFDGCSPRCVRREASSIDWRANARRLSRRLLARGAKRQRLAPTWRRRWTR